MTDRIIQLSQHRRVAYRILVSRGLWKDYEVSIEPPTSTHPLRSFRTLALAMEHAEVVRRTEGWSISVIGGDDGDGGQAA